MKKIYNYIKFATSNILLAFFVWLPLLYIMHILINTKKAIFDEDCFISDAIDAQNQFNKKLLKVINE